MLTKKFNELKKEYDKLDYFNTKERKKMNVLSKKLTIEFFENCKPTKRETEKLRGIMINEILYYYILKAYNNSLKVKK